MKITDIKVIVTDAYRTNWTFVKVETDEGLHGWGEASLGTQENALAGCINDIKRLVVGRDPFETEKMKFEIYRDIYWKGGPVLMSAISGIEMAMWDIKGKYFNTPVYNFFGGKMRDKVKIYANGWFSGAKTPDEFASKAKEAVNKGLKALKWDPFGKAHQSLSLGELVRASDCVGAVREAVGREVDLLIECHGRFDPYTGIQISRELEKYKPMLLEEPCPPDNFGALAEVRKKSYIPVSAGERVYTLQNFDELFNAGAVDIAQPDIFHCGGLSEAKKVASMAEAKHIPVSFHNPSGPVSNAAILNLAAATPNFLIHEIMINDGSFRLKLTDEEVFYEDGYVFINDRPGIGIEVNENEAEKRPYHPINLRHYTGNVTDIRPKEDTVFYFKTGRNEK